jgi:Lar family restriction alleviation protein
LVKEREEYGCYNGGVITDERLPKSITAVWCDKERGSDWSYKTEMPHAEFNIYEEDELYCIGLVIDLNSVLKPCPFCGGEPIINEILPHTHAIATTMPDCEGECFIECSKCSCAISAKNKDEAIQMWNRRC